MLFRSRVSSTASSAGMERYQTAIVDRLMLLLADRKQVRKLEESRKVGREQRTQSDALRSVNKLIESASSYAREEKRTTVTREDFEKAYQANFCMVWPFC